MHSTTVGQTAGAASHATGNSIRSLATKPYAIGAAIVGGLFFLGFFACLLAMIFSGPSRADREKYELAKQDFAKAQKELEELKKAIQEKEALMTQQRQAELNLKTKWDDFERKLEREKAAQEARQKELEQKQQLDRVLYANDVKKKEEADRILQEKQRELDEAKRESIRQQQLEAAKQRQLELENKKQLEILQAELRASKANAEKATIIVSTPPYYPPPPPFWHPGYYRWW